MTSMEVTVEATNSKTATKTPAELKEGVEAIKDRIFKKAEEIVNVEMPRKIIELNELIQTCEEFKLFEGPKAEAFGVEVDEDGLIRGAGPSFGVQVKKEQKDDTSNAATNNNNDTNTPSRKRQRTSSKTSTHTQNESSSSLKHNTSSSDSSNNTSVSSKMEAKHLANIPCNKQMMEMISILKKECLKLVEHCNTVKIWIQLNIPRIEDGNNFGVSIQEETVNELSRAEDSGFAIMEGITKYYASRGKVVSKVVKYPNFEDYVRCVKELDEKEYTSMKLCAVDLRNNYAILYDMIQKNMEKIKKPRTNNNHNVMY
eukprot:Nk52_evm3s470 gene=Nk52_evmTU3s470